MSKADPPQDHRKTIQDIEDGSKAFQVLATGLSTRIAAFEDWLNSFRGRVEAYAWIPLPSLGEFGHDPGFGLRLDRNGKRWMLSFAYGDLSNDADPLSWTPLSDGDLDAKLLAIKTFPLLLQNIKEAQTNRIAELRKANDDFDVLAATVGIKKEGN